MSRLHTEIHAIERIGWLRAAVLGANDGIVSTASLMVGVAGAAADKPEVIIAGVAGLAAGALSMAAGEYVSVSSQSDTESADLARERHELATQPEAELAELTAIYEDRGLSSELARQVAEELTAHDALATHARDELAISDLTRARPLQAALASAGTFAVGAGLPLLVGVLVPLSQLTLAVVATSLLALAVLGALAARAGGAPIARPVARVVFWGALAMAVTFGVGSLFGTVAA
ncbi:VIT family protein [Erythrobacter sp. GH1-10]|uniref:VIT family protein n=1 Tax=Erythrobacter sp. GH1-10 TaxID=3349334 RepID=UPI003877D5CA